MADMSGSNEDRGLGLTAKNMVRMLPEPMKRDDGTAAMARVAAEELERRGIESGLPRLWGRFDDMAGDLLDILAEDLGLTWYDSDAPAAVKRELLKNSGQVFRRLGTKWAVENVIGTYFGEGFVREWFEYDGEPGHFRVYSSNPSVNQERLEEFLSLLERVKRTSAKLDGIFISLTGQTPIYAGVAVRETSTERYEIGGGAVRPAQSRLAPV